MKRDVVQSRGKKTTILNILVTLSLNTVEASKSFAPSSVHPRQYLIILQQYLTFVGLYHMRHTKTRIGFVSVVSMRSWPENDKFI